MNISPVSPAIAWYCAQLHWGRSERQGEFGLLKGIDFARITSHDQLLADQEENVAIWEFNGGVL